MEPKYQLNRTTGTVWLFHIAWLLYLAICSKWYSVLWGWSNDVDATGIPASVLTWSKWNDAVRFPDGSTLQLAGVGLSDIGVYSCTPVNEVGSGPSANLSLDVIGELFTPWITALCCKPCKEHN